MDLIFLHDLKVDCVIGVWQWERQITQSVYIDLDLAFDIAKAARSDQLEDTLSYKDVARRASEVARDGAFNLVETMAERIAETVMAEFGVRWCRVRVNKKGALTAAGDVGVVIERGARDGV